MAGPDIPKGEKRQQIASHVDLYPTVLEALGVEESPFDSNLLGRSLWPAIAGEQVERVGFAEYHALGSRSGSFMLRDGNDKMIYHVGMPPQLFDLANDPHELIDLMDRPAGNKRAEKLERTLRSIIDPEEVDRRARADQKGFADKYGGKEKILELRSGFVYSPPPGADWKTI